MYRVYNKGLSYKDIYVHFRIESKIELLSINKDSEFRTFFDYNIIFSMNEKPIKKLIFN